VSEPNDYSVATPSPNPTRFNDEHWELATGNWQLTTDN